MLLFTKIAARAREPRIDPKMTPKMSSNWVQNGPLAAPGGLKVSSKAVLDFSPKPKSFLDDFQASKGLLNGAQNRSKTGLGAQRPPRGRPRPAQRPPGHLLEAILTKFRTPRGVIFEPPGIDFWAPRGSNCHAVLVLTSAVLGFRSRSSASALGSWALALGSWALGTLALGSWA